MTVTRTGPRFDRRPTPEPEPECECPACAALAVALDRDLAARLAVIEAAVRVDARHHLQSARDPKETR